MNDPVSWARKCWPLEVDDDLVVGFPFVAFWTSRGRRHIIKSAPLTEARPTTTIALVAVEDSMPASQSIRHLAERLVGQETSPKGTPSEPGSAFRVCERLRQPLSSLTGKAGFQALLSRALTLTKPEFPQL